jgi:hypothetical protein
MLIIFALNVIVLGFGAIFLWLPVVTTLPQIVGYNIDGALVQGMGYVNTVLGAIWPLMYVFLGMLSLMTYYTIKMGVKFLLGHRAP